MTNNPTRNATLEPYPSEVTEAVGTATESGQLDLVEVLRDQLATAESNLTEIELTLNPQIDANPEDKLLMEMLDYVSDARESVIALRDLLNIMENRDTGGGR